MAEIVCVVASTHNPRICWNREQANKQDFEQLLANFGEARRILADSKPDIIVTIANDHLDNFFFDNMPTFAVGTAPIAEGPFWYECEIMNLPTYRAMVPLDLAQYVLRTGVEQGIQFSQVSNFKIDHAFTLPLSYLRPEQDLAVLPIMTNAFGYPIPSTRRWYELGQFLRKTLRAWPGSERIAILGSFNLNVEVGGPRAGKPREDVSEWLMTLIRTGARDEILKTLTVPRLLEEGNSTAEFLNYITVLGVVEELQPTFLSNHSVRGVGTCPIAVWQLV